MNTTRRLIITADDYGMCEPVNRAIEKCIIAGGITSFNVMTNMDHAASAAEMRKKYSNISMGLHWTLTTGKPISNREKVSTIVDDNGEFYSRKALMKKFNANKVKKEHIMTELKAQYDKYIELCGMPDYWNTHENVHVAFGMIKIFTKCARELKIKKMRSHDRIYARIRKYNAIVIIKELIKRTILKSWYENEKSKNVKMPNGLITFMYHDIGENFVQCVCNTKWRNDHVGELVIHPADEIDTRYFGEITEKRINEYKVFSDENTKNIFANNNITLVNFSDL